MKGYIEERVKDIADYIIANKSTIREVARIFGVSKSTVHKDMILRLKHVKPELLKEVEKVFDLNIAVRHIRGGEGTRNKYKQ